MWRDAIELEKRERNQSDWESKGLVAIYHAHLGEAGDADRALQEMWSLAPEPSVAHFFTAIVAAKAGRDAREATTSALAHDFPSVMLQADPDLNPPPNCPVAQSQIRVEEICQP